MAAPAIKLLMATAGAGAGTPFDPLSLNWAHAYWTEGPEFVALGLANDAAVGTWPDEIGTADLTQATAGSKPTYKTSSSVNSKPGVRFDGSTSDFLGPCTFAEISLPHTVVLLTYNNSLNADRYIVDGKDASHRRIIAALNTNVWRHYTGAVADGGTVTTGVKGIRSKVVSGTSDLLTINGSNITTASAGDQTMTGLTMGSDYTGTAVYWNGDMAFCGVYSGDVTSDGGWADFVSWASSYYAITIS